MKNFLFNFFLFLNIFIYKIKKYLTLPYVHYLNFRNLNFKLFYCFIWCIYLYFIELLHRFRYNFTKYCQTIGVAFIY